MPERATRESVYEETRERGYGGFAPKNKDKISLLNELLREGKVEKVRNRYYLPEYAPTPQEVYDKIEEAGNDGVSLDTTEVYLIKPFVDRGEVRKVYTRYFLKEHSPLKQKEVIEHLLNEKRLKPLGKTYYILIDGFLPPGRIPSFLEFAKKVQEIYLHMAGEYRRSVNIRSLVNELTPGMGISKSLAEEWVVELPRIFLGRVDLRPFPGEGGLKLDDGSEVARIYLERGLVGL
jgi:hypothetical protein